MRRGRRHPDELRIGDALDCFRVQDLEPGKLVRLRAELRVPGDAFLEWHIESADDGTRTLRQLARLHPRGIAGRLYWHALLPIHVWIFRSLARRIVEAAEDGAVLRGDAVALACSDHPARSAR